MVNKITKFLGIILIGIGFFSSVPFVGHAYVPYVSTGSATNVTSTTATLNGSVNGSNMPVNVWFEYGQNQNLTNSSSVSPSGYLGGNGNFNAHLPWLTPNTTYYFRAVAQNSEGRVHGNTYLFTTNYYSGVNYVGNNASSMILTAKTEPASSVGNTSVELNSLIYNEANDSSQTWFEWGVDVNLVNKTDTVNTGIFPAVKHKNTLKGLTPGKAYYFRAVTQNSSSISRGAILSFVTSQTASAVSSTKKSTATNTPAEIIPVESINTDLSSILGASVIGGAGAFLPTNLFGWVVLVILALVLVLLFKHLLLSFSRKEGKAQPSPQAHV